MHADSSTGSELTLRQPAVRFLGRSKAFQRIFQRPSNVFGGLKRAEKFWTLTAYVAERQRHAKDGSSSLTAGVANGSAVALDYLPDYG